MLRFLTSGESHGPELNIILEGIPANMDLLAEDIDIDLKRRQAGYGRGGRMKIETDKVIFTGGVRHGRTFGGAPVAMKLINKDHEKWLNVMSSKPVNESDPEIKKQLDDKFISRVRPGHADFAGALKYDACDVRDILERSSARETTSRVAVGAVCKQFLKHFGVEIYSHVLQIGQMSVATADESWWLSAPQDQYLSRKQQIENSELRIYDPSGREDQKFKDYIDSIRKKGDTVGGLIEVFALGVPVGLGSHVQWDRRLDGLIAQALMSIHTVKSVEIGIGDQVAELLGSQVLTKFFLIRKLKKILLDILARLIILAV
jgi:chorismate synthase